MNRKEWNKEHKKLISEEKRLINSHLKEKASFLNDTVERFLPEGIQEKLNTAFVKGFEVVFSKGLGIVEKTYNKSLKEQEFRINQYAMGQRDKRSMSGFKQSAIRSSRKNMVLSGAEGTAFGVLGIGLPDIPVFIAMIMKAMQEIAVSYGFTYDSDEEKIFMLTLIRAAVTYGDDFVSQNISVGKKICGIEKIETNLTEEIELTASALSERLLYMKFVQGIPIVGIIGGLSDFTVMKDVSKYARFAYKKRFLRGLWEKMRGSE